MSNDENSNQLNKNEHEKYSILLFNLVVVKFTMIVTSIFYQVCNGFVAYYE